MEAENCHPDFRNKRRLRRSHEMLRGMKEARDRIAQLQSLWPSAFPAKPDLVRPLATGIVAQVAQGAGWSCGYARGVVYVWKQRSTYCKAVLSYNRRFDLNGEPVDESVDDRAREQARRVLAARKARMEARKQKAAAEHVDIQAAFVKTSDNSEAAHMASAG